MQTSARRRAVIDGYHQATRAQCAAWRDSNREAARVGRRLGIPIAQARHHVDAWDRNGFGVPLSLVLAIAFGTRRYFARKKQAGITAPSACEQTTLAG